MNETIKTRKLKIVSDGTVKGTSLVDAETGEPIDGVQRINVDMTAYGVRATLTLANVAFEAMVTAEVLPVLPTTPATQQ